MLHMCNCIPSQGIPVREVVGPSVELAQISIPPIDRARLVAGVRAPACQPGFRFGLTSYYIQRAFDPRSQLLDSELFDQCFRYLKTVCFDDLIVRSHGMRGSLVRHSQVNHPQPYRIEYGVCHGSEGGCCILSSYPSTKCPREFWSKRHMPKLPFLLIRHVCCRFRHLLPSCVHDLFPNSITVHWYPSKFTPGENRGNTRVGFHTDSFCAPGQSTEQKAKSPVITVTFGETMWFWGRKPNEYEAVITALEHASVFIWCEKDDHSGVKHSVQYPYEEDHGWEYRGEGRWVVIARWMERTRAYEYGPPYRNQSV